MIKYLLVLFKMHAMTLAVFETMQLFSPLSFSPVSEEEQTGVEDKFQSKKSEVLPKKSESQEQKSDSQGEKSSCPKVKSPRPKFLSRASRISSLLGRSFSFCFLFLLLLIPPLPPPLSSSPSPSSSYSSSSSALLSRSGDTASSTEDEAFSPTSRGQVQGDPLQKLFGRPTGPLAL